MSQMLKSSSSMAAATFTSRLLGLVRVQVYGLFMGTTAVAGAFALAFMIPNLFRRLLGEGALAAAFIPIFKHKEKLEGEAEMWRAANAVISGLFIVASVLTALAMLGITVALSVHSFDEETRLMLRLLRTMFPYMLLICLTAVFMGMLNARGHFFVPAMGAVVLNLVMIASVFWLTPHFGATLETRIFGLAVGVLVAGLAQALFQLPNLRRDGFRFQWVSPWRNATVRTVVQKMVPGTLGVAAFQMNVMITQSLAFGQNAPIVSVFDYAVRLMEFPQGVFGISLATFLLPTLSGLAAEKKFDDFRSTLGQGLGYLIFINLLASVLLMTLAEPIVRLLFQYGHRFGPLSTASVSRALVFLAPGLLAFSMTNILARAFYALGDVQTPMRISILCLGVNLVLTVLFLIILKLGAAGLGLANTMTSWLNVSILLFALRKKLKRLDLGALRGQLPVLVPLGLLAGLLAWGISMAWQAQFGHQAVWARFGEVFVPAAIAGSAYVGGCWWLRIAAAREVVTALRGKVRWERSS